MPDHRPTSPATPPATSPGSRPTVTVVVVTWQGEALLRDCLTSLRSQTLPHHVLVVDNASTDGTAALLAADFPEVQVVVAATNEGFAGGVARALSQVATPYVALLNNDATAAPDWLELSCAALDSHRDWAAAAPRMLLSPTSGSSSIVNNTGVVLLRTGYGADRGLGEPDGPPYDAPAEVFGGSGGAVVYRTLALKAVGGFDPTYFMYYEDFDVAWRLQLADWHAGYLPDAVITHRHAATSDPDSELFAYYNERNRLLTLLKNAPLGFAARASARFVATTLSLMLKHWLRRPVPARHVFLPSLRLRVLGGALRSAPRALRARRRSSTQARSQVLNRWRGVASR